jgi:hypothetical protein
MSPADFFVGWDRRSGSANFRFLAVVAGVVLLVLAVLGGVAGRYLPRDASLFALSPLPPAEAPIDSVTLRGRISLRPVATVFVAPDASHPRMHSVLLSGDGKSGVSLAGSLTDGAMVSVTGLLLRRGSIDMLVVGEPVQPLAEPAIDVPAPVSLGRWRVAGEICDGKCQTGVMQPGQGLSHRACASLCLIGGVPPVLVTAQPIAGTQFFVLASADGSAPPAPGRLAGLPLLLEGEVERRGDLLIFKTDLGRAMLP